MTSTRRLHVASFRHALDKRPRASTPTVDELRDQHRAAVEVALVDVEANGEAKRAGPCFSPVAYRAGATRSKAGVEVVSCFVIDLDGATPEIVDDTFKRLDGLRCWAFSTWSHGWAKPGECSRIVVPLAVDVEAAIWPGVWDLLVEKLAPACDPSTKDASRLHFSPRAPRRVPGPDGELVDNVPPSWREQDGALFDPSEIVDAARVLVAEREAQRLADEAERERKKAAREVARSTSTATTASTEATSTDRARRYADRALDGECERVRGAQRGADWHPSLNVAGFAIGTLLGGLKDAGLDVLAKDEARNRLLEAAGAVIVAGDRNYDATEAERVIDGGLDAGLLKPRLIPDFDDEAAMTDPRGDDGDDEGDLGDEGEGEAWPEPVLPQRHRLGDKAFHGPLGEIVRAVEGATEADVAALLVSLLVGFGMLCGRARWAFAGAVQHHARLFALIVGRTATARKGTSWAVVRKVLALIAPEIGKNILTGAGSGEGLIDALRDAGVEQHLSKAGGGVAYVDVKRPGVMDKRLLVVEQEFARLLAVAEREGSSLSPLLRDAWDGSTLRIQTRSNPIAATDPHLCVLGHITADEMHKRMATVELFNGLANRFLFVLAGRDKILPFGADLVIPTAPVEALRRAVNEPAHLGQFEIEGPARDLWTLAYTDFAEPVASVLGAVLARRDPIALRLALIYALADNDCAIRLPHLEAALAVVEYATQSARTLFGDALGDQLAERILGALKGAGTDGLTRSQISAGLGRNVSKDLLDGALRLLASEGRARSERRQGAKGGPSEVWFESIRFVSSFRTGDGEGEKADLLVRKDEKSLLEEGSQTRLSVLPVRYEETKRIPSPALPANAGERKDEKNPDRAPSPATAVLASTAAASPWWAP